MLSQLFGSAIIEAILISYTKKIRCNKEQKMSDAEQNVFRTRTTFCSQLWHGVSILYSAMDIGRPGSNY